MAGVPISIPFPARAAAHAPRGVHARRGSLPLLSLGLRRANRFAVRSSCRDHGRLREGFQWK